MEIPKVPAAGTDVGPASGAHTDPPEEPTPAPSDDVARRLTEVEDRWRRAAADLDNARKQSAREIAWARDAERARAASVFLPVVDGLQDAVAYAGRGDPALMEGMESIRDQAVAALERLGYPRIDATGVPFDPRIHEVVSVVEQGEQPPQTVVAVHRLGFGTGDRLLRPAGVVVTAADG